MNMTFIIKKLLAVLFVLYTFSGCSQSVDTTPDASSKINIPGRDTTLLQLPFDFQFLATQLSNEQIQSIIDHTQEQYKKLTDFLGAKPQQKAIIKIFPSTEEKGLATRNAQPSTLVFNHNQIQLVCNDYFHGENEQATNRWIIRQILGKPKSLALEKGLAGIFTPNSLPQGYQHYAKKLAQSDNLPPLAELFDSNTFQKESPILMNIAAASFVDFLLQKWHKTTFLEHYTNWNPSKEELKQLDLDWKKFIQDSYSLKIITTNTPEVNFHGFNFAHEGYDVYNGYGSKLAKESLDTLASLGINAIAIVPYTFMRDRTKPSFLPLVDRAGSETDESVIATHFQAKELQLYTLLKPQIWVHNSWPGDIKMKSEKDWDLFFDYYYRWIRHYALMAEIYQMDILCLGVELSEATNTHPQKWEILIQKIRGIYSGKITYAANWGNEFEDLAFADKLDYIGINCYYPLSKKVKSHEKDLTNGFRKIAQKIKQKSIQTGKPVLFTEIGFRSIQAPWVQPHEDHKGQQLSQQDQALCYKIVLKELEKQPWCSGIFWWKWPSYLHHRNANNSGFTPNQKLATKIFKQFH